MRRILRGLEPDFRLVFCSRKALPAPAPGSADRGRRALGSAGFPFQPRGVRSAEGFPHSPPILHGEKKPLPIRILT